MPMEVANAGSERRTYETLVFAWIAFCMSQPFKAKRGRAEDEPKLETLMRLLPEVPVSVSWRSHCVRVC
jgi:hypothetical protein